MDEWGVISMLSVVLIGGLVLILFWGVSLVHYNEYAIEYEFGSLKPEIYSTGFHWIGFGSLIRLNNQDRVYHISVDGASKDYQDVKINLDINVRLNREKVFNYIKKYKSEQVFEDYLDKKIQEQVKIVLLKYSAEQMLLNRSKLREEMLNRVKDLEPLQYFKFNDLVITNIEFSEEFNQMLERRASVEQERVIIEKQKENLELLEKNINEIGDIDNYVKYKLIEKWDGKADLIISPFFVK